MCCIILLKQRRLRFIVEINKLFFLSEMDDLVDRAIRELEKSHSLIEDTLKEAYETYLTIIDSLYSSCSTITKTEKCGRIIFEVCDCFFEHKIYKIMVKFKYYLKISNQTRLSYLPKIYVHYNHKDNTIEMILHKSEYIIKVEDKYKQDMLNLFEHYLNN